MKRKKQHYASKFKSISLIIPVEQNIIPQNLCVKGRCKLGIFLLKFIENK